MSADAPSLRDSIRTALARLDQLDATVSLSIDATLGGETADMEALARLRPASGEERLHLGPVFATGGMGALHAARQRALGRDVAVKVARPGVPNRASVQRALVEEARITGALEHPNILPIYDIELAADGPRVVMKRIDGDPWSELMGDETGLAERTHARDLLTWNLEVLLAVGDALRFAHSQGILHLDLKPQNVMIGPFGEVYLLDWGIARSLRADDPRFPRAADVHDVLGTPAYMAPELLACDGSTLSERTDVYLLGATLFEILSGHAPHDGDSLVSMFFKAAHEMPRLPDGVDPGLAALCRKALQLDPDKRLPSVDAFLAGVREHLAHRGARQLADAAQQALEAGEQALAAGDDHKANRRLLEARFGFRQALDSWAQHPVAAGGLRRTLLVMAEREIDAGRSEAAATLLDQVEAPPSVLLDRLRALRAQVQQTKDQVAELEQLGAELDLMQGRSGRLVLYGISGLAWAIYPLFLGRSTLSPDAWKRSAVSGAFLLLALLLGWFVRESLKRGINRRIYGLLLSVLGLQWVLSVVFALADASLGERIPIYFANWTMGTMAAAFLVDRRVIPTALGYLAGAAVTMLEPSLSNPMMSAAHFLFVANIAWIWNPWSRRPTR